MKEFLQHLNSAVPARLERYRLPGAAIGLIDGAENPQFACFGTASIENKTAITTDSVFQIASISKAVSAWGVMKLVEQGKLDLDRPVEEYLTRWAFPASRYDSKKVTARLLLMHHGGTSLSGCGGTEHGSSRYSVLDVLNGKSQGLDARHRSYALRWGLDPDQYGRAVRLEAEPGIEFIYSGGGFCILELLIEELSGLSFSSFMYKEVLLPLGMKNSSFELSDEMIAMLATPYDEELDPMPLYDINGQAAGGMYSTITDLCRFAYAEMEGAKGEPPGRGVLQPESIAEMHQPALFAETEMGLDFYTGLGHYVVDMGATRAVQHTGGNPGWRSIYTVLPDRKRGFVCLINSAGGNDLWLELINEWAPVAIA